MSCGSNVREWIDYCYYGQMYLLMLKVNQSKVAFILKSGLDVTYHNTRYTHKTHNKVGTRSTVVVKLDASVTPVNGTVFNLTTQTSFQTCTPQSGALPLQN